MVIQVNGRKRGIIEVPINTDEEILIKKSKTVQNVSKNLENKKILKQIYIKNKLLNFII